MVCRRAMDGIANDVAWGQARCPESDLVLVDLRHQKTKNQG